MLYIILLLIFLYIIYLEFNKKLKSKEKKLGIKNREVNEKITSEEFINTEEKHYGNGLMIPLPAYKANTSREDSFNLDIHKMIKNSKTKNIHQLYQEITNDNYSLFNNLNNLQPNESSHRKLYQNQYYNPKKETKYIFSTGLPKVNDLIDVNVYNPSDKDYINALKEGKEEKKEKKESKKID